MKFLKILSLAALLILWPKAEAADFASTRKRAENGDVIAQFEVGGMYSDGNGVKQDYVKAREWYLKAAEQGYAPAQNRIGVLYNDGKGVKQDYKKAREWYLKAAEQGNGYAFDNLGWLYQNGYGVKTDYKKAIEYYTKGAEKNVARSMNQLGWIYDKGLGVKVDYVKAREWYLKAAARNNRAANTNLGWLYQNGLGVKADYEQAFEYYSKGAELGSPRAMNQLGWLYEHGWGVNKDEYEAFAWYTQAAENGNAAGLKNLGRMHEYGITVKRDINKATELYEQAAAKGNDDAKEALARLKTPSTTKTAKTTAARAAKQDNIETQTTTKDDNRDRARMTVRAFDDRTGEGQSAADAIMDMMVSELSKTQIFALMERERLDDYIGSEIRLGQSGLIEQSTAPAVGKLKGVQYTMTGAITVLYYSEKASGVIVPLLGIATKAKTAYVVLDIRIIDNVTGEIVYASDQTGQAKQVSKGAAMTDKRFLIGGYSKQTGGLLQEAARDAVKKHVSAIKAKSWQQ